MKKIKRLVACLCVCVLLTTAPTTAYAKANSFINSTGVEEVIVIGGFVVSTETALGFALSLLGLTAAADKIYENRDAWIGWCNDQTERLKKWFSEKADDLSITWDAFQSWLGDVANGALDTSSECWDAFKDFCTDLANKVSASEEGSGSVTDVTWTTVDGVQAFVNAHAGDFGDSQFPQSIADISQLSKSCVQFQEDTSTWVKFTDDYVTFVKLPNNQYSVYVTSLDYNVSDLYNTGAFSSRYDSPAISTMFTNCNNTEGDYPVFSSSLIQSSYEYQNVVEVWRPYVDRWLDFSNIDFGWLYYARASKGLMGLVSGIAIGWDDWTIEVPDVTPVEDVSDIIVAPDTQGVIERDGNLDNVGVADVTGVIDGVISIPIDGVDGVSISNPYEVIDGVYPVDTIDGTVLGTDTPIDGIVPIIPDGGHEYTIPNLQELFPFCIPFDLVNLFSVLKAKPEAPKISFPIPVPDGGMKFHYEYIEVDLSKFDSVAKILRTLELLAFCVGLTIATRALIRG